MLCKLDLGVHFEDEMLISTGSVEVIRSTTMASELMGHCGHGRTSRTQRRDAITHSQSLSARIATTTT